MKIGFEKKAKHDMETGTIESFTSRIKVWDSRFRVSASGFRASAARAEDRIRNIFFDYPMGSLKTCCKLIDYGRKQPILDQRIMNMESLHTSESKIDHVDGWIKVWDPELPNHVQMKQRANVGSEWLGSH